MLYAILCYHDEDLTSSWTKEQDAAVMKKLAVVQDKLAKQGRLTMLNPYLFYNGNCEAAFKFYEKTLGGRIEMLMRSEEAPADMPAQPGWEKKIMHARMSISGETLMASDAPPDHFHKPQGFSVSLTVADPAEAERKFKALCEGGSINMPFGKTFFSRGFGMGVDQFGIPWMVNCPLEGQ